MTDNLRSSTSGLVSLGVQLATLCFIVLVALCEVAIAHLKVALCWVGRAFESVCERVPGSVWWAIVAPPWYLFVALPCLCILVPSLIAFLLYTDLRDSWDHAK